ncbi:hypothetical protein J6590_076431, partial [Homalodisca vitripennis]
NFGSCIRLAYNDRVRPVRVGGGCGRRAAASAQKRADGPHKSAQTLLSPHDKSILYRPARQATTGQLDGKYLCCRPETEDGYGAEGRGRGITTKNTTLSRRTSLGFCPTVIYWGAATVMIGTAHYISLIIGPDVFMNAPVTINTSARCKSACGLLPVLDVGVCAALSGHSRTCFLSIPPIKLPTRHFFHYAVQVSLPSWFISVRTFICFYQTRCTFLHPTRFIVMKRSHEIKCVVYQIGLQLFEAGLQ